ncbi:MAG: ornithine carbamoyltransferase [Phycisphaerales bacterium]
MPVALAPTPLAPLRTRHLTALSDVAPDEFARLLTTAALIKGDPAPYRRELDGRSVILLFEKDSLRTRCSFEVGVNRLGGHAMYMDHSKSRIGERESIADYARNLDRFFAAIVARVYSHSTIVGLAKHSSVPVVNALCDQHHPCQALADFLTLRERFVVAGKRGARSGAHDGSPGASGDADLRRIKLAYIGDVNNVAHSLLHAAALAGATLTLVAPPGCGNSPSSVAILREAQQIASRTGATIRLTDDPGAVAGHHAVYTDTWFSMGYEPTAAESRAARLELFAPYQVNRALMAKAGPDAIFMHCLPAHRGEEVTDDVIDSPNSAVYDQAENRLHAQNALMVHLVPGSGR